jgi:hypothetical protein
MSDGAVYKRTTGKGRREVYYLDEISREWQHPWFVTGFYEDDSWKIQIKPGFVNGEPAMAPSDELEDGDNTTFKRIPLTDRPKIPLPKNIFEQPARAPDFFKRLGVKDPEKLDISMGGPSGVTITIPTQTEKTAGARTMLQCVVFMSQARASQKLEASIPGNLLLANIVEYTVTWDDSALSALGRRPRINVAKELPDAPTGGQDLLNGLMDDNLDHLPLATLYFVSPPAKEGEEPPEDTTPGAAYELYVKHDLFWNVSYAAKNRPPINIPGFALGAGVAAFVGRYTVAPLATLGAMNAASSLLLAAAFNSASNRGRFWTV